MPLVSIIVPTFNRAELICDALASIAGSTWPKVQTIVADDGSTDPTKSIIENFCASNPQVDLVFLELPHCGAASARNAGLEAAQGELIYFLDSDDLLLPHGLETLVKGIEASQAPYCVAEVAEADLGGNPIFTEGVGSSKIDRRGVIGSQWATHAAIYRRSSIEAVGGFDPCLMLGEDKELLWRLVAHDPSGILAPEVVAVRRNHGLGQLTDTFTPVVMGRSMVATLNRFFDWAEQHDMLRLEIALAARRRLWLALVRLGAEGNWRDISDANTLAARIASRSGHVADKVVAGISPKVPRPLWRALNSALAVIRRMVHAFRNVVRRMKVGRR